MQTASGPLANDSTAGAFGYRWRKAAGAALRGGMEMEAPRDNFHVVFVFGTVPTVTAADALTFLSETRLKEPHRSERIGRNRSQSGPAGAATPATNA